jgi:hypothetical protein
MRALPLLEPHHWEPTPTTQEAQTPGQKPGSGPSFMAEGVGFEPTAGRTCDGFQDRSVRPLRHPSRTLVV